MRFDYCHNCLHESIVRMVAGANPLDCFDITTCDGIVVMDYWEEANEGGLWIGNHYDSFFKSVKEWWMGSGYITKNQLNKMKKLYMIPDFWKDGRLTLPEELAISELDGYVRDIEAAKRAL